MQNVRPGGPARLVRDRARRASGVGAGWERGVAERHFETSWSHFEIGDEIEFVGAQARHLRKVYPRLTVAPLLYRLDDRLLYIIDEGKDTVS